MSERGGGREGRKEGEDEKEDEEEEEEVVGDAGLRSISKYQVVMR